MCRPTTDWSTLSHASGPADVATGRSAGDRVDAVSPAGFIVGEAEPEDRRRFEDEIAELITVCRACTARVPADDPKEFVHFLQFLLAFEGVPFWGAELERLLEEFEAECPECEALTEVIVGEYPDDCTAVFHPAGPAALTGIGARLHAMALRAGQDAVAEWVSRLFGRVTCTECDTAFDLAESATRA
ncbi:hypothetical protein [Streptomyces sp. YKOK-I1]